MELQATVAHGYCLGYEPDRIFPPLTLLCMSILPSSLRRLWSTHLVSPIPPGAHQRGIAARVKNIPDGAGSKSTRFPSSRRCSTWGHGRPCNESQIDRMFIYIKTHLRPRIPPGSLLQCNRRPRATVMGGLRDHQLAALTPVFERISAYGYIPGTYQDKTAAE
jgi:hypothetical protein